MSLHVKDEPGQAMIELAFSLLALLALTAALVDVGRGIYVYNNLSAVARYGARWASVVGGNCRAPLGLSTADWCDQIGAGSGSFWLQAGNTPLQGAGTSCPGYSTTPADYYTVSSYATSTGTTIVGAIAKHFDTSSSSYNTLVGNFAPGLDLTQLKVCIAYTSTGTNGPQPGDTVTVTAYYPFSPAGHLITSLSTIPLTAQAQWQVEG
jgi:hypothetical protein